MDRKSEPFGAPFILGVTLTMTPTISVLKGVEVVRWASRFNIFHEPTNHEEGPDFVQKKCNTRNMKGGRLGIYDEEGCHSTNPYDSRN